MDPSSMQPLLEDLSASISDLETALSPLLNPNSNTTTTTAVAPSLTSTASKLPLLDKAKLYVLATYTLESLLFSYLRISGVDAKSHAVFRELARVREYFSKISAAESNGTGAARRVDKQAAARFVRHGLAGNERVDREREQVRERERAGAKRKLEAMGTGTHTRFDGAAKRMREGESEGSKVKVVKADDVENEEGDESAAGLNTRQERGGKEEAEGANSSVVSKHGEKRSASSEEKKLRKAQRRQQRKDAAAAATSS